MLMTRPDDATLYAALLNRDPTYEGRVWVAVSSTGVFCRLTCPARKPKAENCSFHDSIAGCLQSGFRPCKRCKPLAAPEADIQALIDALEADPTRRWTEAELASLGHDPATLRRRFKRLYGMTFLDMARQRRLAAGFTALSEGARVIDAQFIAGFESASAFRDAFTRIIGLKPGELRSNARLRIDWIDSDLGPLVAVADDTHLHLLEFIDRKALPHELRRLSTMVKGDVGFGTSAIIARTRQALGAYFAGKTAVFDIPLALHGTSFSRAVWRSLQGIPAGETRSYGALAAEMGRPTAVRAVARANGANQIAILIPCHRIIGAAGQLTGYGGGIWRKDRLLALENHYKGRTP